MKKRFLSGLLTAVLVASTLVGCGGQQGTKSNGSDAGSQEAKELDGEITFWHSFTQGPRLEVIQKAADNFMQENPKVKINIETFSWGDFYTKWTTGLASGNVPDREQNTSCRSASLLRGLSYNMHLYNSFFHRINWVHIL